MNQKYYLKYSLLLFLNLLLSLLSYMIPKTKNQILLGAKNCTKFFGNTKYFFLYLQQNENPFKFFWITANKKLFLELKTKNYPVVYLYSRSGFMKILRSNFLLMTHGTSDVSYSVLLPGKFNKIQTWHGSPIKKIGTGVIKKQSFVKNIVESLTHITNEMSSYHTILSTSDEFKEIYTRAFENNRVVTVGYPRNDVFFNHNLIYERYDEKFNLSKYENVFLYCPTFRDTNLQSPPFSEEFLSMLDDYLAKKNSIMLIKSHINQRVVVYTKNLTNIIDVSEEIEDVQDLLVFTSVLISDFSGIFYDFVLLEKPIIFYSYDYSEYLQNSREFYFDYYNEFPGPFAKNQEELFEIIKSIDEIFMDKEYLEKYIKFKNKYNLYDDKSCERLINHLMINLN